MSTINVYGLTFSEWIDAARSPLGAAENEYPRPKDARGRWSSGEDPTDHAAAASLKAIERRRMKQRRESTS